MATIDPFGIEPVSHLRALDADAVALEKAIREANQLPRDFPKEDMLTLCIATREAVRADDEDRPVMLQALHEQLVMMRRTLPGEGDEETDEPSYQRLRNILNELATEAFDRLLEEGKQPDPIEPDEPRLGPTGTDTDEIHASAKQLPKQGEEALDQFRLAVGPNGSTLDAKITKIVNSGRGSARIIDIAIDKEGTLAKRLGELAGVLTRLPSKLSFSLKDAGLALHFTRDTLKVFSEGAGKLGDLCLSYAHKRQVTYTGQSLADAVYLLDLVGHLICHNQPEFAERAIESLKKIPNYQKVEADYEFEFFNHDITDISPLSGLSNLKHLDLRIPILRDISVLASLVRLESLDLEGSSVTDISPLAGLSKLRWLDLSSCTVRNISAISGLRNLEELYLQDTYVSDVSALSALDHLKILNLRYCEVSDMTTIATLGNLNTLLLGGTKISDASALSSLKKLKTLDLVDTYVTDVKALSSLQYLTDLRLPEGVEDNRTNKPEPPAD